MSNIPQAFRKFSLSISGETTRLEVGFYVPRFCIGVVWGLFSELGNNKLEIDQVYD